MLTSDQKGAVAESAIIHAAVKLGIRVFKPVNDGERYDLIFDLGIDVISGQRYVWLRLAETRNNQAVGVRWARDFDFTRLDWERLQGP